MRRELRTLELDPPLVDDACLLASELVSNSIRHSGLSPDESVRVSAVWSGTKLRMLVQDRPAPATSEVVGTIRPEPGAESGWGLFLVDQLASRWGTASGDEGGYWFELEARKAG